MQRDNPAQNISSQSNSVCNVYCLWCVKYIIREIRCCLFLDQEDSFVNSEIDCRVRDQFSVEQSLRLYAISERVQILFKLTHRKMSRAHFISQLQLSEACLYKTTKKKF